MSFFDKKEEVLQLELTPYGKSLLSLGIMDPVYYAFFDHDILYDIEASAGAGAVGEGGEAQNEIDRRIKYQTPSLKVAPSTNSAQTRSDAANILMQDLLGSDNSLAAVGSISPVEENSAQYGRAFGMFNVAFEQSAIGRALLGFNAQIDMAQNPNAGASVANAANLRSNLPGANTALDSLELRGALPLGTSDLKTKYAPAWEINCLENTISASQNYYVSNLTSSGTPLANGYVSNIPQIDIEVDYECFYATPQQEEFFDVVKIHRVSAPQGDAGVALYTQEDYVLLEILERNTDYGKDNFDMEVFAIGNFLDYETIEKIPFSSENGAGAGSAFELFASFDTMGTAAGLHEGAHAMGTALRQLSEGGISAEKYLNIRVDEEIPTEVLDNARITEFVMQGSAARMNLNRDMYAPDSEDDSSVLDPFGDAGGCE